MIEILQKISKLRHQKANLLGFDSHADFVLDRRMAQNKKTVYDFIDSLVEPSYSKANEEVQEISEYAKKIDGLDQLESFDLMYYGEKLKQDKYNFSDEVLRPYFKSDNVVSGVFKLANKLIFYNCIRVFSCLTL